MTAAHRWEPGTTGTDLRCMRSRALRARAVDDVERGTAGDADLTRDTLVSWGL